MERTLPGLGQTVVTSYAHAKKFKELRTKEAHDSEVKELAKNLFKDSERARKPKKRRMQCPEGGTVTPDGHIIRVAQSLASDSVRGPYAPTGAGQRRLYSDSESGAPTGTDSES